MAATQSPVPTDTPPAPPGRRLSQRTAYVLIVLLLLFIVVFLPFAVQSMIVDFRQLAPPNHAIATVEGRAVDHGNVAVDLIGLNEWEGTVTVRVTAYQECDGPCRWRDRYRFVSIWGDDFQPSDRPTVELVTVPESPPVVTRTFQLPLSGNPLRYPFDRYALALGVVLERLYPDGREETLTLADAEDYVTIWASARIPKIRVEPLADPTAADPAIQAPAVMCYAQSAVNLPSPSGTGPVLGIQ